VAFPSEGFPHLNPLPQAGEEANEKGSGYDLKPVKWLILSA